MMISFNTHNNLTRYLVLLSPLTDEEMEGQRDVKQLFKVTHILGDKTGFQSAECDS